MSFSEPVDLRALYNIYPINLDVCIDPSPCNLDLGTLDVLETRGNTASQRIQIRNCGESTFDIGLTILSGGFWTPGYMPGDNRFTLRAALNSSSTPPATFDPAFDLVRNTISWATSSVFGSGGYNITSGSREYIWFSFIAPMRSEHYDRENTIVTEVRVKLHIP
jgi:hypothetical protein